MDDNNVAQTGGTSPAHRALAIAGRILTVVIVAFAVLVALFTIVSVAAFDKVEGNGLFGYKLYSVRSDSMANEFAVGDVVAARAEEKLAVQPGDIITFRSIDPANYGEVVTHKVRELTSYEGKAAYVTYGTATGAADSYPALKEKVIGTYRFRVPKAGYLFDFLKSLPGYFALLFIPFGILLLSQGFKFFRLVKQYKQEQKAQGMRDPLEKPDAG